MAVGYFTPDEMATPDDIEYRKKLAQSLMGQGMSAEPIKHWTQGAARLAQALVGAGWQEQARADQKGLVDYENTKYASLFGGPTAPVTTPAAAPAMKPAPSQAMTAEDATPKTGNEVYRNAIASIESKGNGDYAALGPVVPQGQYAGDRAYGRYQVMGANVGPWTKQALGREMTPQEFLADQNAQDKVFDHIFGQNVAKYGSPQDAASVWFTGRPQAQGANASDVNGMTGSRYVQRFNQALGQPVQTASAAPVAYAPPTAPIESSPLPAPQALASALSGPPAPNAGSLVGMGAAPVNAQGFGINAFAGAQPPAQPAPEPRPQQVAQALTGQPAAPAAAPAVNQPATPMAQPAFDMNRYVQFMGDPRIRPEVKQRAQAAAQMMLAQQGVTPVDLGDRIALMDKAGNVKGYMPKSEKPVLVGEGQTLRDPRSGAAIGPEPKSKIEREVAEREQLVRERGMDPNDSRVRQFVLTGTYPKDPELTATDRTAILEADELVSSNRSLIDQLKKAKEVSPKAYGNAIGNYASPAGAVFGDEASKATVDLNNIVAGNALSSLKTIFGGNPTEGERKILLDLQGSGSQPDEIRQKIYDRAIEAAQKRLQFNQQRSDQLRGGTFYKPGGNTAPAQLAPDPLGIR